MSFRAMTSRLVLAGVLTTGGWLSTVVSAAPETVPTLQLQAVRLLGGEGLPLDDLKEVYQPYLGQAVTLADLEEIRYRLTKQLTDQGYINSGALIVPQQDISDGVVEYQLITGRLEEVQVSGQGRLRAQYITGRVQPAGVAFNRDRLHERFQLLLEDPLIDRLHGSLVPGSAPGEAVLELEVERARPWELSLRTDNHRPPSTGAERIYLGGTVRNLTGFGDSLTFHGGFADLEQGREGSLEFRVPLNAQDTTLQLRYAYTDATLLEKPLAELEIASETERVEALIMHPLVKNTTWTLHVGGGLAWAHNRTTLLGERFDFNISAVDGESRSSALRLVQEATWRERNQAFAVRSIAGWGIDMLDATIHHDGRPDTRFFVWSGQGQYVHQLNDDGLQLVARGAVQLAGERLLPLEQITIGGAHTVRGYRENTIVSDNGYAGSLELRYPLWAGQRWFPQPQTLHIAAFSDLGGGWDHSAYRERDTIASVGLGLLWTLAERAQAELYWGHRLESVEAQTDHNLQDDGLHFMARIQF